VSEDYEAAPLTDFARASSAARTAGFQLSIKPILKESGSPEKVEVIDTDTGEVLVTGLTVLTRSMARLGENGFEGYVENNPGGLLRGWCWRPSQPEETIRLSVYVDGELWQLVDASTFRRDLQQLGKGTGLYGFSIPVPNAFKDGKAHLVDVQIAGTGVPLDGSPLKVEGNNVTKSTGAR
jgi:hypothetical protein